MDRELLERIDLIERMVLEGRRRTQYWGWCLALWGSGQLIAAGWSAYSHRPAVAWGVTMAGCGVVTGIVVSRKQAGEHSETLVSRAVGAVWFSLGMSLALLGFLGNSAGIFTPRSFIVVFFTLMGLTFVSTGLILRWKVQTGIGLLWWAASVVTMFGPDGLIGWLFASMIFLCEVVLGLYLMARERADLRHARVA